MSAIFTSPYLKLVNEKDTWSYRYLDGRGQVLATVVQVAGPAPPQGWFRRNFSSGDKYTQPRIVLRVDAPGGPLFFVDRADMPQSSAMRYVHPAPCAVVAPDGRVLGRIIYDTRSQALGRLADGGIRDKFHLLDDQNRPLCTVLWERLEQRQSYSDAAGVQSHWSGGRYCDFTDARGAGVGRYDRGEGRYDEGDLTIACQLPQPLHSLVGAAPIGMALLRAGVYGDMG